MGAEGASKEAFIFETIVNLMHGKINEYEGYGDWGTSINSINDNKKFRIHNKTKWLAIKTLEKEGYVIRKGHSIFLSDDSWSRLKDIIIKFHMVNKTVEKEEG